MICTLSRIWRSHIPGRRTKLRQTHTSTASAYRSGPLPAKYCRHESTSPQANVALTCRVRDEQRLRAPPVADTASRGWRSGRNAASVERGNRISGTARVGCNPVPSTQKEKRPSKRMISSLCWHLPIVPGRFQPSIVGTSELNCRVRDGNGCTLTVISTNYLESI